MSEQVGGERLYRKCGCYLVSLESFCETFTKVAGRLIAELAINGDRRNVVTTHVQNDESKAVIEKRLCHSAADDCAKVPVPIIRMYDNVANRSDFRFAGDKMSPCCCNQ